MQTTSGFIPPTRWGGKAGRGGGWQGKASFHSASAQMPSAKSYGAPHRGQLYDVKHSDHRCAFHFRRAGILQYAYVPCIHPQKSLERRVTSHGTASTGVPYEQGWPNMRF
jgi:hypothetical protein